MLTDPTAAPDDSGRREPGAAWNDGLPVNLPAAAFDALAWLDFLGEHHLLQSDRGYSGEKLERVEGKMRACADALREQVRPYTTEVGGLPQLSPDTASGDGDTRC
jgi:hypothetical protein